MEINKTSRTSLSVGYKGKTDEKCRNFRAYERRNYSKVESSVWGRYKGISRKMGKIILRRLIPIIGVSLGTMIGVGVTFLIGFIAEVISQPKYPDLMMGWYLWSLLVCVPLFAAIFGILFHRLISRF